MHLYYTIGNEHSRCKPQSRDVVLPLESTGCFVEVKEGFAQEHAVMSISYTVNRNEDLGSVAGEAGLCRHHDIQGCSESIQMAFSSGALKGCTLHLSANRRWK